MSENRWLKYTGVEQPKDSWQAEYKRAWNEIFTQACGSEPNEQSPLETVKTSILALSNDDQRKIYEFLYNLGHRINR